MVHVSYWLIALRARMARAQDGQSLVEYALILVLIAVVVILLLTTLGRKVNNVYSNISNGLGQ